MVDPIGIRPGTVVDRRAAAPVGAAEKAAAVRPARDDSAQSPEAPAARQLAGAMAAKPPIDSERVAQIRRAIENGTFPLVPSTIADRLLALRMQWNPNDEGASQ